MHLREARAEDAEAVAAVRIAGWRHAYAGVMPRQYLDALSEAEDAARHRARLAAARTGARTGARAGSRDLVAVDEGGAVAGWASSGPYRAGDGAPTGPGAELYALYVRPHLIGTGVGRLLTEAVRKAAVSGGAPRLWVWVVEGNTRACRFYERAGFAPDGTREDFEVAGRILTDLRYGQDLTR